MRRRVMTAALIIFLLGSVAALIGIYYYQKPSTGAKHKHSDFVLKAGEIAAQFKSDAVAADKKYLSHTLRITGKLASEEKDQSGLPVLYFQADGIMIQMSFIKSEAPKSGKFAPGELLTVKGDYAGYDDLDGMMVQLNGCSVEKDTDDEMPVMIVQ